MNGSPLRSETKASVAVSARPFGDSSSTRCSTLICAGGAGFPVMESLEDLYITIMFVLFTLGGDSRNFPFPSKAL